MGWSAIGIAAGVAMLALTAGCVDDAASDTPPADSDASDFAGCPETIPEFTAGLAATGEAGRIRATLLDASRFPPRKYANEWTLALDAPDGAALDGAEATALSTFMPVHGHYGRPPAEFEPLAEAGTLRARVHFTMRGPWEVRLDASSARAGDDHIVFHVCVEE